MNFASFPYLVFIVTVACIYFCMSKKYRHVFLLFASYFFYSIFGIGFAALMLLTSIITYTTSYYSYYTESKIRRRLFFYIGLILDLLIFILFKYIHIIDLDMMNWPDWSAQKLLIPVGISFYTFKTVGYCIDVYKRRYPPEDSFVYYALSVSFFPQLIAGPIEKSVVISSQFKRNNKFDVQHVIEGGKLILWGLFKKIVIADSIAQIINPVFNTIYSYSGLDYVIALMAFTYQIYADFSGYSDIAIGSAKCLGIVLPANFNKPYFSKNYREFWTRWHITFSKWLKEYVFDELGGYGKLRVSNGKLKIVFNLWILFLIVGFWHGATFNFFIYCQLAFLLFIIDVITKKYRLSLIKYIGLNKNRFLANSINYVAIIMMIAFLSVFFRLSHFEESMYVLKHINLIHFNHLPISNCLYLICYIIVFEFFQYFQITADGHCFQNIKSFYFRVVMYIFMLFAIILLSNRAEVTFQYFQF